MADEPDPREPLSLEYERPNDFPIRFIPAFLGFVAGAGGIGIASVVPWMAVFLMLTQRGEPSPWRWACVAIFAAVALGSVLRLIVLSRRGLVVRRTPFIAGLLVGLGVASLVEGVCFSLPGP